MLARAATGGDKVDPAVCRAAIVVMVNPPADPILAFIADHLAAAAMDFVYFNAPISRLQVVVAGFLMAGVLSRPMG
jgi:hypothetical protein